MTIVVDASVAVKWLVPEADSDKAEAVLRAAGAGRLAMLAPEILSAEVGNFLWKAVFRGHMLPAEALALYGRFRLACPALVKISVLADSALGLALRHRRSVYDCLYLALATETECDFLTADAKFFKAVSAMIPRVRLLSDWT